MEQGEKPEQPSRPSLDKIFEGILIDGALKQQLEEVKEPDKQQRRRVELERNAPFIQAGEESYQIINQQETGFTAEAQRTWDNLQKSSLQGSYRLSNVSDHPAVAARKLANYDNKEAAYASLLQQTIRESGRFPDNARWSRVEDAPADLRYFFYGYGKQAIEKGNVKAALIALDEGNWLDDKVEGPELQRQIGEKVAALTDPKAKVDAAMTWKGIQEAKVIAPPNPPVPPTSAPQP